ncbi:MAG: DNA recombination protein RmuC [Gemmatimonadaceae bacterium]
MTQTWLIAMAGLLAAVLVLQIVLLRTRADPTELVRTALRNELSTLRQETVSGGVQLRTEIGQKLDGMSSITLGALDRSRETLAQSVKEMQEGNEKKLELMRQTVDEKLQGTLDRRLGESFTLVQQQLESVQKGLGEMQQLATGVGDLKKVLSNVKTRGIFGEVQLRAILEEILTPDQFCANYAPSQDSRDHVEFAVALPGPGGIAGPVFLPIDSKFPQEDYLRLLDASDRADIAGVAEAREAMYRQVKSYAKTVCDKYIVQPQTTPFAIVFLPTESLYAEVLRQPGLVEELQRKYSIALTGPTTLGAFLTSLRMGFHTIAIEKRASEVWNVLGAVKTEFLKFGEVLDKVHRQLDSAQKSIGAAGVRKRAMEWKLRDVQSLSVPDANRLLESNAAIDEADPDRVTEDADADD